MGDSDCEGEEFEGFTQVYLIKMDIVDDESDLDVD